MIEQSEIVESHFGYWREFCDGKVACFSYEAPDTVLREVPYTDVEKRKGEKIRRRFVGVSNIEMSELRSDNVIESLRISKGYPARFALDHSRR